MTNGTVRPADLEQARAWLAGHDLPEEGATPLLATRLGVRRRTRLVTSVLLAAFICVVALIYISDLPRTTGEAFWPDRRWQLLVLTAAVVALVLTQSLLDRRVRRADRRAGATLARRVAHPVRLGWRAVLGLPRAALAAVTYAGTAAMAVAALTEPDPATRYAAVILLIGLCGTAIGMLVQLRHILAHPAVADDETSLTADVIMRVEDAREAAVPTVVWSLPVVSVLDTTLGWWTAAWLGSIVLGVVALALINAWTAHSGAVARHATNAG